MVSAFVAFSPINLRGESLPEQQARKVSVLGIDLVIHKTPDVLTGLPITRRTMCWSVSDPVSRCRVVQYLDTMTEAVKAAELRIIEVGGVEAFYKARDLKVAQCANAAV